MTQTAEQTIIEGKTGLWEMVIGLEVHAQVSSQSKLFSRAPTAFGADPNRQVSLVDAALPGTLPVTNTHAIRQAVLTGMGIGATINLFSVFDRKHYFYPDLPQGYQITQYHHPIVSGGSITITTSGPEKTIRVERLHLEQDAGKSVHDRDPSLSAIDLNRSGIPLMEIVLAPDLRSAAQAGETLRRLRTILRYLGTCDGNMEEGSLRADVNVSVRRPGEDMGTRCEIKNLNSIRFIQQAIEFEARRQIDRLEGGESILQQTRLFNTQKGATYAMRSKEEAHDYRYFPDPDLPPLVLEQAWVDELRKQLPELPDARKARFMQEYSLPVEQASVLTAERETADFFETVAKGRNAALCARWVSGSFFAFLNKSGKSLADSPITNQTLGELLDMIESGTLSERMAKDVFELMETGDSPNAIAKAQGLIQISDESVLKKAVTDVIEQHADQVAAYRAGKDKVFGYLVGQVMKATSGKANPKVVNQLLREVLGKE